MIAAVAFALVGASIALAVVAALREERLLAGVPLMLDVWLAAGLLRLTQSDSWTKIAAAAALIGIRKLVGSGLREPRLSAGRSPRANGLG